MRALGIANDGLRFFIELAIIVVFGWFGWWLGSSVVESAVIAVLLVALAGAVWASFAAPRRRFKTPGWVPGVMFLIYGALAAAALVAMDRSKLAMLLVVLVIANEGARLLGLEVVNREDGRG